MMDSQSTKRRTSDMTALKLLDRATEAVLTSVRFCVTLPYQRLFIYNTLRPAQEIQKRASRNDGTAFQFDTPEREELWTAIEGWRTRKRDELQFVAVAVSSTTFFFDLGIDIK